MAKSKRKSSKRRRSQNVIPAIPVERPLLIERLADAALIGALFTVLAFSEIRFEGFETEKAALMPIFGGIILASHVTCLLRHRDVPWKKYLLNPVVIGVIGIIVTSIISSLLGFSPVRSWFGEAERLSGLQTLLMYLLLFSQAVVSVERITPLLSPIIITISAPLCLSIFFATFVQNLYRPGSTTGNPNYLSSWLVMSMLMLIILLFIRLRKMTGEWNWVLLPQLLFAPLIIPIPFICWTIYQRVKDVRYGWKWQDWAYLLLILFMLVFMTATIVVVGSRAALLSYAIGGMTSVGIILTVAQERRLLLMFSAFVIIAGSVYVGASFVVPREIIQQGGVFRVLNLYDSRRQELWGGAVSVIKQQHQPYYLADGTPDALASVRPIIGYGLSVIPQTQGRFGATTHENQFVGSFHNHIFDYIVMTGYPGMLFYILFYFGAIAMVLRQFRLIHGDTFLWLMVLMMFGLLGVFVAPFLFSGAPHINIIPIGVTFGVLAGNFIWISVKMLLGQLDSNGKLKNMQISEDDSDSSSIPITDRQIVLAGLLGVIILRWVDIQFAFVQAASEPMFWVLAGLFLGHFYKLKFGISSEDESDQDTVFEARPIDWQVGVLATGIMIFYGFGVTVNSNVYNHAIGLDRIPFFIAILVIVGHAGAFLLESEETFLKISFKIPEKASRLRIAGELLFFVVVQLIPTIIFTLIFMAVFVAVKKYKTTTLTIALWIVMGAFKSMMSTIAGDTFDNTISPEIISQSGISTTFFLLSLTGILMVVLLLIVWTFYDNWRIRRKYPIGVVGAIVLAIVGGIFYSTNYMSATAHALGIGFMEEGARNREELPFVISDVAFNVSTSLDPTNARMRAHYLGMMTQQNTIIENSRPNFENDIETNVDILLQYEPYFIHTLEWQQFSSFHERLYGKPFRAISRTATEY